MRHWPALNPSFVELLDIYRGNDEADSVACDIATMLNDAIPRGAEAWAPMAVPPLCPRAWFSGCETIAARHDRGAVQLVYHLARDVRLTAREDVFVTFYDHDGFRLDMAYVQRGEAITLPASRAGYILNVALGSRDGRLNGVELTGPIPVGRNGDAESEKSLDG